MVKAYIMIVVRPGTSSQVVEELSNYPEIKDISEVYGEYDIIAQVEEEAMIGLRNKVDEIRESEGVENTTTMIVA